MNLTYWTARQDKYIHSSDIPKEIEEVHSEPLSKDKTGSNV